MDALPARNVRAKRALLALALAVSCPAAAQAPLSAHITGGIGLEERAAMEARRGQFNLQLTFALQPSGNYLAAVDTLIADAQGKIVLRIRSDGPFVWAQLAPGTYAVAATYRERTQSRRISVPPQGAARHAFYWEETPD